MTFTRYPYMIANGNRFHRGLSDSILNDCVSITISHSYIPSKKIVSAKSDILVQENVQFLFELNPSPKVSVPLFFIITPLLNRASP